MPRSLILACIKSALSNPVFRSWTSYLCKGAGVKLVLGSHLETDVASCLRVPSCLGAGLDLSVDLMVVAGGEDTQIVGGSDSSGVRWLTIACSKSVFCDGSLSNIVSSFCANKEAFVTEGSIEGGGGALEDIGEETCVDVGLLVVEVEFAAVCLLDREVVSQDFGFETLCQVVFEFELSVKGV